MRRFAAGLRAVMALLCTAVLMAAPTRLSGASTTVVLVYDLFALVLLWTEARARPLAWPTLPYWVDVTWMGLLLQLQGSSDDMLILTAVQPVLLLSIGYSVGQGVMLAVYAALWMVVQIDRHVSLQISFEQVRMLQALAVIGLVPAAALLARPINVLRRRLALLRSLETRLDPRRGLAGVARSLVAGLREDIQADLTGVVLPAAADGMALLCTAEDGTFPANPAVHARIEALLAAMPDCAVTHVRPGGWRWREGTRLHGDRGGLAEPALSTALDALCDLLGIRMLVVVPLRRYDLRHGHLLVGHAAARHRDQEVQALSEAVPAVFRVLEQATLVDRLVRETAAHERVRIGRDLHDSAIQPYLGFKYALEAMAQQLEPDNPALAQVRSLTQLVEGEIGTLRDIVTGLRNGEPVGDNALLPAVRRQVRHFGELFGIDARLHCPSQLPTSRALAGAVFHMVNEALNNVRRHTPARRVDADLSVHNGWLRLSVRDDAGTVLGRPSPEFHPRSLSERAQALGGMLSITHPDGLNTEVVITVPLDAKQ